MAISLRELLAVPRLGLALCCPGAEGALDASVHWVHQSELDDSSLFTEPGEVLMTTGSQIPAPDSTSETVLVALCDQYVRRLRDSSVVGLGFGVGVHHQRIPGPLLAAAAQHGLPLFEIPYRIPFSALIKAVSKSRSDAEHAFLRRTNSAQRRLIAAAGRPDTARAVIAATSQIIGGWAALADTGGEITVCSDPSRLEAAGRAAVDHLLTEQAISFPSTTAPGQCVAHTVTGDRGGLGVVLGGTDGELDPLSISSCMLATNLLGIHLSLSGRLENAIVSLRSLIMSDVLDGNPDLARKAEGLVWMNVPVDPITLVCITGPPRELARLNFTRLPAICGRVEGRCWVIAPADQVGLVIDQVNAHPGLSLGRSASSSWQEIARAKQEALSDLLGRQDGASRRIGLVELLPPEQALAFAHARLGQLAGPESSELLHTLQTWMAYDCANDRTAGALGVHRHTVRRRMERIEELLGVDLSLAEHRHELWFACQVVAHT